MPQFSFAYFRNFQKFLLLYEAAISPSDASAFVVAQRAALFLNRASLLGFLKQIL